MMMVDDGEGDDLIIPPAIIDPLSLLLPSPEGEEIDVLYGLGQGEFGI